MAVEEVQERIAVAADVRQQVRQAKAEDEELKEY